MTILLIGEYSRLHNSLKEGLVELGHNVALAGSGDGFKQLPSDYSYEAKWSQNKIINIFRQGISRIFRYDFAKLERGIRFYFLLKHFKDFDAVQFINERPIKCDGRLELYLLKRVAKQNKKLFLLCCGADYITVNFMLEKRPRYSIMTPFFEDPSLRSYYDYMFEYCNKSSREIHQYLYSRIEGVIASDIDYLIPLKNHPKFLGLIPNPVNLSKLKLTQGQTTPIVIFLGINRWNAAQKGIRFFEEAIAFIKQKYGDAVEIIISENLPYSEYIRSYERAHIILDQVYGFDQGYNALEAMAKGKVVFTGAETEFMQHYGLTERVAINALPDTQAIANELEFLIQNPPEIVAIAKRARAFVEKEHDYLKIAQKYVDIWR